MTVRTCRFSHRSRPSLTAFGPLVAASLALAAAGSCGGGSAVAPSTVAWPQSARVEEVREELHAADSGKNARALFPDLTLTYVDEGGGRGYPTGILPFRYYWSPSARVTIAICAIERTVFVCPFQLRNEISPGEFGTCDVADIYKDPPHAPPVGR